MSLTPLEWQQEQNLVQLTNADVDFVQVKVTANRTSAGSDPRYGTFQAMIPGGKILAQGSTLLETSFHTGGASWLRRIMSIYVEGGYVKVRFKSSNRSNSFNTGGNNVIAVSYSPFNHPSVGSNYADPNAGHSSIASNFNFTFEITVGKFTK